MADKEDTLDISTKYNKIKSEEKRLSLISEYRQLKDSNAMFAKNRGKISQRCNDINSRFR